MADKDKYADEVMSDEELDGVVGGRHIETSMDSSFLNALTGSCGVYSPREVLNGYHDAEIAAAWREVGVIAGLDSGSFYITSGFDNTTDMTKGKANLYMIIEQNGAIRPVTRTEAMAHAVKYVNSHS